VTCECEKRREGEDGRNERGEENLSTNLKPFLVGVAGLSSVVGRGRVRNRKSLLLDDDQNTKARTCYRPVLPDISLGSPCSSGRSMVWRKQRVEIQGGPLEETGWLALSHAIFSRESRD
jgi:hypothetical protein